MIVGSKNWWCTLKCWSFIGKWRSPSKLGVHSTPTRLNKSQMGSYSRFEGLKTTTKCSCLNHSPCHPKHVSNVLRKPNVSNHWKQRFSSPLGPLGTKRFHMVSMVITRIFQAKMHVCSARYRSPRVLPVLFPPPDVRATGWALIVADVWRPSRRDSHRRVPGRGSYPPEGGEGMIGILLG